MDARIAPVVDAVVTDPRSAHAAQRDAALGVALDLVARKVARAALRHAQNGARTCTSPMLWYATKRPKSPNGASWCKPSSSADVEPERTMKHANMKPSCDGEEKSSATVKARRCLGRAARGNAAHLVAQHAALAPAVDPVRVRARRAATQRRDAVGAVRVDVVALQPAKGVRSKDAAKPEQSRRSSSYKTRAQSQNAGARFLLISTTKPRTRCVPHLAIADHVARDERVGLLAERDGGAAVLEELRTHASAQRGGVRAEGVTPARDVDHVLVCVFKICWPDVRKSAFTRVVVVEAAPRDFDPRSAKLDGNAKERQLREACPRGSDAGIIWRETM
eukprot:2408246-Pleurochrysis_carterae.AAC.2